MADCIHYAEGYKYQLRDTYTIKTGIRPLTAVSTHFLALDCDGNLTIAEGYAWDGASGPTWDSKCSMRASLVHDALYQLMRLELLSAEKHRAAADALFERICVQDKMWRIRAAAWHWAVRNFARRATEAESEPPDECAPAGCCDGK
jgi:hypothetical protein